MGDRGRVVLGALAALLVAVGVLVCLAGGAPPDPDPDYVGPANVPAAPGAGGPHEAAPLVDTQPDAPVKDYRATPDRTQLPPTETWIVRLRAHRGRDEPFAGARLRAAVYPGHEARGEPLHETTLTSGEDGAAVWHLPVPAQTVTVEVGSGDAEVVGRKAAAVVLEGEAARTLDVYLFPLDHVVRGVVTTADGKPVAAARVSWSQYLPPTYTDDQGRFRLRVASAYSRLRYYVVLAGYSRFTETLSLDGPGTTDVEVQLQPGFRAFGRVTDTGGRPLQGVQVATFWARYTGEQTLTDAEGNYQLDTLDPAVDTHYVLATLDGYARAQGHARGGGTEARIDLVLKCTATVTGTVFGPAGRPLAGAMVGISGGSRPTGAGTVVTGDDGHFTLHPSRRGKPYLWTHRRGFAIDRRYIELAAGTTHVLVHLQRGHFVAGRVTDPDGQPVPGARLRAYLGRSAGLRNDVITGADGRYRLLDLPEQKLRLTVSAPGHVTVRRRELVLDSESFDIVLQRSVVLRGRVVDGSSGAPIQEFRIRVLKRSKGGVGMPWLGQGQRFHDTDGYWKTGRERVVPGTTFDLEAVADGYAPTVLKNITATPDMAPNAVLFQLFAGVALHGQVLCRATGRPVAGAKITLLEPGRRRLPPSLGADTATRSADDGTFIF
ncbi:MAG: carboxypeptidase regulatory-like domain-containing protein, partial [Planctomycetota bacterium]